MITTGSTVKILKGCRARDVVKGRATVISAEEQERGRVRIVLQLWDGRKTAWYAQHKNRLSEPSFNLNDGNPLNKIVVRLA